MQLGMIGLGRMGGNIVRRLMKYGHSTVVFDKDPKAVAALAADGAAGSSALEDFVSRLEKPRTAWVMLPAGKITEATIDALSKLMQAGDVVIDGGNTFWQDDVRRGKALKERGINYIKLRIRKMQLGMIGLGRMGGNIVRRLMKHGHSTVVYDKDPKAVAALAADGAAGSGALEDFVGKLEKPRTAWVMLPAGKITEATIDALSKLMQPGDVIIDGGNTFWQDDVRRGKALRERGINYIDVGTSGGVWGIDRGYCMMIGGDKAVVDRLDPIFAALAPGVGDIERTGGREGRDVRIEQGYIHAGPVGAGHFVKMVHNGIEYGLMQAYAEGFDILKNANIEALPAEHRFDLDIADIAEVWRRGSVIPSWLLDLTASALAKNPTLESYSGFVEDSGEGRWTVNAAIDEAVPAEVLTAALFARFRSRKQHTFAEKILSAMRDGFGGHKEPQQHPDPVRQNAPDIVKPKADRS